MVKTFEQYISSDESDRIDEGFLDTVKKAIGTVAKAPEQYVEHAAEQLKNLKAKALKNKEIDPELYAEELEKLNNDEDLGKIYKMAKKFYFWNNDYGEFIIGKIKKADSFIDDLFKKIDDEFDCGDNINKKYAVYDLANLFCAKYISDANKKDDKPISHSSDASKNVARNSAIAAAVMMAKK